jgi:hypothetical protein
VQQEYSPQAKSGKGLKRNATPISVQDLRRSKRSDVLNKGFKPLSPVTNSSKPKGKKKALGTPPFTGRRLLLGQLASGALHSRGRPGTDTRVANLEAETECKENWLDLITSSGSERNTKQNGLRGDTKGKRTSHTIFQKLNFPLQIKQDYFKSTAVTVLSPSFDYWNENLEFLTHSL